MPGIKSVLIMCRMQRPIHEDVFYEVGYNGVTKINHCIDDVYQVFKGDKLIAKINNPDVITYFEEKQ